MKQLMWLESSTLETIVDVWRYTLLVVHAIKQKEECLQGHNTSMLTGIHGFRLGVINTMPRRPDEIPLAVAVSCQQVIETNVQSTVRLA